MKSIVLVNPPSPFLKDHLVMPPLGLMYLSSYLKSKNIGVTIHDLASSDNKINKIQEVDIMAFTATTPQYPYTLKAMKSLNCETIKVIGGPHVSSIGNCNSDGFDISVIGEGELALSQIVMSKNISNSILVGSPVINLDNLPFPDREWNGFEKYHYKFKDYNATTAMTSRGCPYNCGFCFNMFGNNVRFMSPEKVIEEAKIISKLGFDMIQYYDDTFTIIKHRVKKISNGIKKLNIKYRCFIRANTVNKELLYTLRHTGCIEVGMGVESGSQKIINNINKQITIEQCKNVINYCHKIGLSIKIFLMIGLPYESKETVNQTIDFLKETKPDDFDYSIYTPFPHTDIWNNKDKYDINFNKNRLDYLKMFYKGVSGNYTSQVSTSNLSSEEIEKLRDYVDIDIRNELYE